MSDIEQAAWQAIHGTQERAIADAQRLVQHVLHHMRHTETDPVGSPAKGTETVSLSSIAADVKGDLQNLLDNAQNDYNRVKTSLEQKLPEVEKVATAIDNDPLVQLVLSDVIPAPLRTIAVDMLSKLSAAFPVPAEAVAVETPAPAEADPAPAQ